MLIDPGTLSIAITGLSAIIAATVWFVRLEGRIDKAEALHVELKDDVKEIKKDVKELLRNGRDTKAEAKSFH